MPDDKKFYMLLDKIRNLHDKKKEDYATKEDPYSNYRIVAQLLGEKDYLMPFRRLVEKTLRACNLLERDATPNFESLEDTLLDIAVLSLITIDMMGGENEDKSL